ncbi:MAG: ankyrin repeat protein [Sulfurimonas sp.]|jgi:ankyrin repeat protein
MQTISKEEEQRYAQLQVMALDFARVGETSELQKMIEAGISVNLSTHKDDSLLMLATYNGNYETAKMLIEHNADLDRVNQREQTPLDGVCFKGDFEIVKLLISSGAKIGEKTIVYATMFGHNDIADYLQINGANENKMIFFGISTKPILLLIGKILNKFKTSEPTPCNN